MDDAGYDLGIEFGEGAVHELPTHCQSTLGCLDYGNEVQDENQVAVTLEDGSCVVLVANLGNGATIKQYVSAI